MHNLKYGGTDSKRKEKKNAVYNSDTSVTLKQGQGNQTWYEFVDPKEVYDNTSLKNLD